MTPEQHARGMGKLMINFQSLEFSLRLFLCEANNETVKLPDTSPTQMEVTHMTNYDSLGDLLEKYNSIASKSASSFIIDTSLVKIRDAIAHGRTLSSSLNSPVRLFKFSKPKNNMVKVVYDQVLDEAWYKENIRKVFEQIRKVYTCSKQFNFKSLQEMDIKNIKDAG